MCVRATKKQRLTCNLSPLVRGAAWARCPAPGSRLPGSRLPRLPGSPALTGGEFLDAGGPPFRRRGIGTPTEPSNFSNNSLYEQSLI